MGFALLPLIVLSFFVGVFALQANHARTVAPSASVTAAASSAEMFVAYRGAIMVYQQNYPTFTGTVPNAALTAQGNQFSAAFLATAGNVITATGSTGRVVTSFAALPPGSMRVAFNLTGGDVAIGMASGANWISAGPVATLTPLATPVPNGSVVSVSQIGN